MSTLNLQIDASFDDASQGVDTGGMIRTRDWLVFGDYGGAQHSGYRFTGVSGLSGATINTATLTFRPSQPDSGAFIGDWYAEDAQAPPTFGSGAYDITNRSRTTATCEGDGSDFGNWDSGDKTFTGDGVNTIAGIIQELADTYDPSAIVLIWLYSSGSGERLPTSYDSSSSLAPKLDIDYTAATGDQTMTPDPAVAALVAPSVTLDMGTKTLTPSPAIVALIVPSVTIKPATKTLTPDPAILGLAVPTPSVTVAIMIEPDAAALGLVAPDVVLVFGTKTLTPDPATIPLIVPTVMMTGTGAAILFETYMWTVSVDPDDYPTGVTFRLVLQLYTTNAATPARAQFYNVTDGVVVSGSALSTTQTTLAEVIGPSFSLSSGSRLYRVEYGGLQGGEFHCEHAKLKVVST